MIYSKITDDFLIECEDDYVGLWSLVKQICRKNAFRTKEKKQIAVAKIIKPLLEQKLIVAGNPRPHSKEFIFDEWNKLDRDPDIGEVIWFTKK